ncbi:MAG: hypothetical protein DRP87_19800 [Spirochaetes bacterium]|nr:MAG: hypothetical protein DRP87_19800 [Spirochaetota bacterium]
MKLFYGNYIPRITPVLPIPPLERVTRSVRRWEAYKEIDPLRWLYWHFVRAAHKRTDSKTSEALPGGIERSLPSLAERLLLDRLRTLDRRVRTHEQLHMALLNGFAKGPPSYTYTIGPDGRLYATGGSIEVDLRAVPGDPEATMRKARMIRRAALAPGSPSPQDRRVAAEAYRLEMEARREMARQEEELGEMATRETGRYVDIYA